MRTVTVILDSGKPVQIKRVTLDNLARLTELQEILINKYVTFDGSLGNCLLDEETVNTLRELVGMLPIISAGGKPSDEYLCYDDISENWEQTVKLFFNFKGELTDDIRSITSVDAPIISNLHYLNYDTMSGNALHQKKLVTLAMLQARDSEIAALVSPVGEENPEES